jgi:cell division septum initiation protein DivIVA
MNLFKKKIEATAQENKDLSEEVEALKIELAEAKALAVDPSEELATLKASNATLEVKLEDSAKLVESLEAKVLEVEATALTEQEEAASKIADFDSKVAEEVTKKIADQGLDEGLEDAPQPESVLETFAKLSGAQRSAFYKANKQEIQALTILK